MGQDKVTTEIVKTVFPYTTFHKLEPTQTALNLDPGIKNDRLGLVGMIINKAEEGYKRVTAKDALFETYGSIVNAYRKVEKGEMTADEFINKVAENGLKELAGNNDDPIKYSLAIWLLKIHNDVALKYKVKRKK